MIFCFRLLVFGAKISPFVSAKSVYPLLGDFRALSRGGIESRHDGDARAFHFSGLGVDHTLRHPETAPRHACHLGEYGYRFGDVGRREEVAIDVYDHYVDSLPIDSARHYLREIARLAEVEQCDVDGIVEMSEHIEVVESQLHRSDVAKRMFRHGYSRIGRLRQVGWLHDGQWNMISDMTSAPTARLSESRKPERWNDNSFFKGAEEMNT